VTVTADRLKQRMITRGFQEKVKQLVNGAKLENFPKIQGCLLQSYVMITGGCATHDHCLVTPTLYFTDYLLTAWKKDREELESTCDKIVIFSLCVYGGGRGNCVVII